MFKRFGKFIQTLNYMLISACLCLALPSPVCAQGYQSQEAYVAEQKAAKKAESMMHSGKLQDAIMYLNGEVSQNPRSAILNFELGNAHLRSREFTRAIECYQQAVRLRNPFPEACLNAAYACLDAGMELQAIPWFHKYLRENPN